MKKYLYTLLLLFLSISTAHALGLGLGLGFNDKPVDSEVVWDISGASYIGAGSVSSECAAPADIWIVEAVSKLYMLCNTDDTVYQYSITNNNVSSLSYDTKSFSVTTQENNPRGISFNPAGTTMYIAGLGADAVFQYTLTAGDITTSSYATKTLSIITNTSIDLAGYVNNEGTEFFTIQSGSGVRRYTLSTPDDISSGSYTSSFALTGEDATPYDVHLSPSGKQMITLGQGNDDVYQYTVGTANDITGASYDSVNFDVLARDSSMTGLFLLDDGTKLFTVGTQNDSVYQWNL